MTISWRSCLFCKSFEVVLKTHKYTSTCMCAHMHMCVHAISKEDVKETQTQPTLCTVGSASKDGPTPHNGKY